MPFILGVLIAIGLSATLVSVMLGNTFGDHPMSCGFGPDAGYPRSGFLRVVVRTIARSIELVRLL